jgi:hypothetical protein
LTILLKYPEDFESFTRQSPDFDSKITTILLIREKEIVSGLKIV